jgi:hypothetical protein
VSLVLALLLAQATPAEPSSGHRANATIGLSHWFGPTFGNQDGLTTPTIGLGVQPGVRFLEIRVRYALALTHSPLVGFLTLGLVATKELQFNKQHLEVYAGPEGLMVHDGAATFGFAGNLGARWMFDIPTRITHSAGLFFEAREVFYTLPGDPSGFRHDAQIDLGGVVTLF